MQVKLPEERFADYKSKSQRVRVATEGWAQRNLYCANCDSPRLARLPANTRAVDFNCPECGTPFQLKAQSHPFACRILDAAYSEMIRAIRENRTPNLLALHYQDSEWSVVNLILIPSFAFPISAIEKRRPLVPGARRAGWVGCNILLDAIPQDARIPVIAGGTPLAPSVVRQQYARIRPLAKLKVDQRGWTLDVLNAVRSLRKTEFALGEVYRLEEKLTRLHPANKHVRDKIRQQLQVLRDIGIVEFLGGGEYRLKQ